MTNPAMMIPRRLLTWTLLTLLTTTSLPAQKRPKDLGPTVLATVGTEQVLYRDVERAFQKNLTRRETPFRSVPRDTALDFIRLYTNYRLKVASARDRSMDQDEAVQADIANNRKLLSETWYFDHAFANARIEVLAGRRTREVKTGIILCAVTDPVTKKWDTTASLAKAKAVIARLNAGAPFDQLARDSSDDKETAETGGTLPWISGGSIIKVVEDEAYALPVGKHSTTPVISRFGYFIVKVYDAQPRAVVKFRHILLQKKENRDSVGVDRFADSLLTILNAKPTQQERALRERGIEPSGDVFSDLAKAYSDDEVSAQKGGYLGSAYSRSGGMEANGQRLVGGFEDAVFALKDGQISGKVHTIFGVHIIIRDSTKMPDEQMERDAAKRTYRRLYFEDDKRAHYDSLKTAFGYAWIDEVKQKLLQTIDTTKNTSDTSWWKPVSEALQRQTLYQMPNGGYTVKDVIDSLRQRMDMRGYTLNTAGFDRALNKMVDPQVLDQATTDLDKRDAEFAALLQEFNDGILLFKVEEQEVWSKLKFDTADARVFYDTTKARWMTEQRYRLSEIYVLSDTAAATVSAALKAGAEFAELAAARTQREGGREKRGSLGVVTEKNSMQARKVVEAGTKAGQVLGPIKDGRGVLFIRVDENLPPRQQSFDEALPSLATAYQDALQQRLTHAWLDEVRKRHPVVIDMKNVNAIWGKGPAQRSKQ